MNIVFFFLGYIIGKSTNSQITIESQPNSFFQKDIKEKKDKIKTKLIIDESKYVTDIKTSDMEKKYENLGENIESSINKLKNLKG